MIPLLWKEWEFDCRVVVVLSTSASNDRSIKQKEWHIFCQVRLSSGMSLTPFTWLCLCVCLCMHKKGKWHVQTHANTCWPTFMQDHACLCAVCAGSPGCCGSHTFQLRMFLCESRGRIGEKEDLGLLEYLIQWKATLPFVCLAWQGTKLATSGA